MPLSARLLAILHKGLDSNIRTTETKQGWGNNSVKHLPNTHEI